MNTIIGLDIITTLFLFSIIFILFRSWIKDKNKSRFVLFFAFIFLFVATLFNFPEHLQFTQKYADIEVLFDILFLPSLILAIHITIINQELLKRKINEQKFRAIFTHAYSLIGYLDGEGKVLEANEKALKLVNVTNEQVEQSPFEETLWWTHSENEQKKLVQALNEARKGKVVRMETFHINTNNSNSFIDFTITPIFIDSKKPVNFIVEGRDITELKQTQIELEKHKNNLEQLVQEKTEKLKIVNDELLTSNNEISLKNEIIIKQNDQLKEALDSLKNTHNQLIQAEKMASLGILTDGVAHEINNPLNYLMGASEGLDSYFQENGSTDKITTDILVHSIRTGVDRISAIVKSLNQFGRDNAKFDENCDVHSIIDNCLIILNNQLQHRILVKKDFTGEDAIIKGNVGKLHQVFLNILTNAIQAIVNEGEIRIQTIKKDTSLFIQIVDNGCGINPDDMLRITDPFFSTKPAGKGTGLGLSITYSILKEHNGSIEIESEMNKGTTAKITIPYTKPLD